MAGQLLFLVNREAGKCAYLGEHVSEKSMTAANGPGLEAHHRMLAGGISRAVARWAAVSTRPQWCANDPPQSCAERRCRKLCPGGGTEYPGNCVWCCKARKGNPIGDVRRRKQLLVRLCMEDVRELLLKVRAIC